MAIPPQFAKNAAKKKGTAKGKAGAKDDEDKPGPPWLNKGKAAKKTAKKK